MKLYTSAPRLSTLRLLRHNILLLEISTQYPPEHQSPSDHHIPGIQSTHFTYQRTKRYRCSPNKNLVGIKTFNQSSTLPLNSNHSTPTHNLHLTTLPLPPSNPDTHTTHNVPPPPHPPFPHHQTPHPPILLNKHLPTFPTYPAINTIHLRPKINTTLRFKSIFNMAITYKMHGFNQGKCQDAGSNMGAKHNKKPMAANPRDESPEFR